MPAGTSQSPNRELLLSHQLTRIDGFAQGILKSGDIHLEARQTVQKVHGQAINVKIENLIVNAPSAAIAFTHTVVEPLKALYANDFDRRLDILVDALDEAAQLTGQESIVDLLTNARGLPPQVCFVLTSRPESAALRHFERLSIPYVVLDAGREENLQDVREYVRRRLEASEALQARLAEQGIEPRAFVERVTEASQGNFLYLVWLLRSIAEGTQRFDALYALPQGLDRVYCEFLRTRTVGKSIRQWRDRYRPLLGVLAAAQAPLTSEQLAHFTGLDRQAVRDLLLDVQQFLDPVGAGQSQYRLYHQSVIDFLSDEEQAGEFWIDLVSIHSRIAAYYQERYAHRWPDCDLYGLRYLPAHFVSAEDCTYLTLLLTNLGFLEAKVGRLGVDEALTDLRIALRILPSESESRHQLQALLRVLDREFHNLRGWNREQHPAFFAQQMRNRAADLGLVDLANLASIRLMQLREPYLVQLWRTGPESPRLERTLTGHTREVEAVAVTPDGRRAISASWDGTLKVWDLQTGLELHTLIGHTDIVNAIAVTPDGRRAISASWDGTLKVWDLRTGQVERTLAGHKDGVQTVAVASNGRRAVSGSLDNTLKLWDLRTGRVVLTLKGHTDAVEEAVFTPNGHRVVSASRDSTVRVWDLRSGQIVHTFTEHVGWIHSVVVTPDGQHAISSAEDRTLRIWELQTGQAVRAIYDRTGEVLAMAITPDSHRVICACDDHTLKIWDLRTGQKVGTLTGHESLACGVAITPDGRCAISASSDHTLKVWDLDLAQAIPSPIGHKERVQDVTVTSDGCYVVSVSSDRTLKVWNLQTGQTVHTLSGHLDELLAVATTPDGRYAISGSWDMTVKVWDVQRGHEEQTFVGHEGAVWDVAVIPGRQSAISASWDGTLKIWDLRRGQLAHTLREQMGEVCAMAVSPDSSLVLCASFDNTFKILDLQTGSELRDLSGHESVVWDIAITPSGRYAVSASNDNTLKIWDLQKGQVVRTLAGHEGPVYGVAITLDGRFVISASQDRTLRVWDLQRGRQLAVGALDGALQCVAVVPDSTTILAGDRAGNVYCLRYVNPNMLR